MKAEIPLVSLLTAALIALATISFGQSPEDLANTSPCDCHPEASRTLRNPSPDAAYLSSIESLTPEARIIVIQTLLQVIEQMQLANHPVHDEQYGESRTRDFRPEPFESLTLGEIDERNEHYRTALLRTWLDQMCEHDASFAYPGVPGYLPGHVDAKTLVANLKTRIVDGETESGSGEQRVGSRQPEVRQPCLRPGAEAYDFLRGVAMSVMRRESEQLNERLQRASSRSDAAEGLPKEPSTGEKAPK